MATDAEIIATTTDTWLSNDMADNIHKGMVVLEWLMSHDRIGNQSGDNIKAPITFAENDQADDDFVADTTRVTTRESQMFTSALYPWSRALVPIHYDQDEMDTNAGPERKVDLVMSRFKASEASLKNKIERVLMSSGGANKSNGLVNIVGTVDNAVGGINASTASWWNPTVTSVNLGTGENLREVEYSDVSKAIRRVTFGQMYMPSLLLTRDKRYGELDEAFQTQQRVVADSDPDMGWAKFAVANVPICYPDETLAANLSEDDIYILNHEGLEFVAAGSQWLRRTPVNLLDGSLIYQVLLHCRFNLVSGHRRVNGVLRLTNA